MGYGRFVIRAAEKLAAGAEMADVIDYLNERFSRVEIVLSVHSLKIIKRSGRISAAAAFAGELLGLRCLLYTSCGSIAAGIAAGILAHVFIKLLTGKFREIHPGMYVLCIPLVMYFIYG